MYTPNTSGAGETLLGLKEPADLELTMYTRMTSKSHTPACHQLAHVHFFLILCALVFCLNAYVSAGPPGTGAIDSCELPCRCWEWNWGSQEEQSVLFNLCAIIPMRFFWGGFFFCLLRQFNSPGCLGTHSVGQASLELSNLPTAAS